MKSFFAELKRRNVYRAAVGYAAVAWLLMQVATQTLPFFDTPAWAVRVIIVVLLGGFPFAMIWAWVFEWTPKGIVRTDEVPPGQSIARDTRRKLDFVISTALALAVALLLFDRFRHPRAQGDSSTLAKSIAVLPFDNLSDDKNNAYFAEGVQDEILTRLAKVAELKVISRTSTQRLKSSPNDLPQIARQLGVMHILEGSVQKSGDAVRVNVQLIKADTDAHLWADTFDRKLTDIFQIETEIAKTIADTLQAKLTGSEQHAIAAEPGGLPALSKGQIFLEQEDRTGLAQSDRLFQTGDRKDPQYALAYAGLADSYVLLPGFGAATPQECFPQAKAAAKKALEIDDTLAEAHTSLAQVLSFYDFDFAGSIKEFERAISLNPNYATAHHWFGGLGPLMLFGEFDRAIAEARRAVELDPLSLIINADLAEGYFYQRRYDEAIEQFRRTLEIVAQVNQDAVVPNEFSVLHSIELNLNPRGEGDLEPGCLAKLDLVLASFHFPLRLKDDQTGRYLAALRNPVVHILGHPRGRIYNYRAGLSADWSRVFAEASSLDKAVEIDCFPDRQDLNVELLTLARAAGTRVSLGTDAHHPGSSFSLNSDSLPRCRRSCRQSGS